MTPAHIDTSFLLDQLPDLVLLLDSQGAIHYANRRAQELLGDAQKLVGKAFYDLVDERDKTRLPQQSQAWSTWRSYHELPWEIRLHRADGQLQLVSGSTQELSLSSWAEAPDQQGILLTLRPIGKPNDNNIRRDLLIAAIEAADSSVVVADILQKDSPLIYANQGFLELTGYQEAEVLGKNCRFLQFRHQEEASSHDDDQPELAVIREALKTGTSTNVILRNYRQDGSLFYNDLYLTPIYENEQLVAFVGVQNDITQRVQAQELRERELIETQAREQERIARDLHDSVQQQLHRAGMLISFVQLQLGKKIAPEVEKLLEQTFATLQQTNEQVRAIAYSLYPINLAQNGLMIALQHLATTTQEAFNVQCKFAVEQPVSINDSEKATHLYRIVQEAINNAIRHGQARQILINLAKNSQEQYTLTICDDGVGISEDALTPDQWGIGVNSMRYRAKIIEADFRIERGRDGGTIVTCLFTNKIFSS